MNSAVCPNYNSKRYISNMLKILYIVIQTLVRALALLIPFFTEALIDSVSAQSQSSLYIYTFCAVLAVLIYVVLFALASYIRSLYEEAWIAKKRAAFLENMTQIPLNQIHENGAGFYLQRFSADIEGCRNFIINKPVNFVLNILYTIGIIGSMLRINIGYAFVLLAFFPAFVLLHLYLSKKVKKLTKAINESEENANALLEELYRCNYSIRASNADNWYNDKAEAVLNTSFLRKKEYCWVEAVYDLLLITGLLNLVSVMVYTIGGQLALWGKVSYGMIVSMSLYYSKLWSPLEFFLDFPKQYAKYQVYRHRVDEIVCQKVINCPLICKLDQLEQIEISSLTYAHKDNVILENLSFNINKGDHIAISGGNGSGKTTLANVLTALYDGYNGVISYNGIDYCQIEPSEIREHICLIPAAPELFTGSIRDNLLLGKERSIPECVLSVLNDKGLQLELVLQGNGSNISSGEAKILQLLRGVCRDADCYIIDEPLNFIDDQYVDAVINVMEKLFSDKTVVIISHDDRTFRICHSHYMLINHTLKKQTRKGGEKT